MLTEITYRKSQLHKFETDELYQMWVELRQLTDPQAVDAQLQKLGGP
jgi:hypothetical protein